MKYMTVKNFNKAKEAIILKGYRDEEAETIAINCFAFAGCFNLDVMDVINKRIAVKENN